MKTILAAILAISLAGCQTFPPKENIQVVWHKSDNPEFQCPKHSPTAKGKVLAGCQWWEGTVCHVVAPPGTDELALEMLGHEVRHCFDPDWKHT